MNNPTSRRVPRFFTINDIAQCLGVSTRTVRRWIKSGALVAHRFGVIVRISEPDFAAFLAVRRGW
jgi:excisionase family DNA binding protein